MSHRRSARRSPLEALSRFKPLMVLRYSATHKVEHNKVHRLDALDAYNQKLVKKIAVRGITARAWPARLPTCIWMRLRSPKEPAARARRDRGADQGRPDQAAGEATRRPGQPARPSGELASRPTRTSSSPRSTHPRRHRVQQRRWCYRRPRRPRRDRGDKRRIQIREVIRAHLDKERELFTQGIKVLSLFFIDEVAKYRDYAGRETPSATTPASSRRSTLRSSRRILGDLELDDQQRRTHASCAATTPCRCTRATSLSTRRPSARSTPRSPAAARKPASRRRRRLRPDPERQGAPALV